MRGDSKIIDILNDVLTAELTAINQYFIHAKMCENWGYHRLAEKNRDESIDEMKDADALIDRILYLEGVPNMQRYNPVGVGETVPEQLELDRQAEVEAIERYARAIGICVAENDWGTRELLEGKLRGEEDHLDWIETQLELIRQVGLENYLSQQIHG